MPFTSLEANVPNEIWNEVFRWFSYWDSAPSCYQQLYDCMQVCRLWHALIMADPWLWCDLAIDCSPLLTSHILERSKDKPLRVDCDIHYQEELDEGGDWGRLWKKMVKFADRAQHSVCRWSTLNIDILHFELDPFVGMLETPAPRLRSVSIEYVHEHGEGSHRSINLFQQQAGNILELRLGRVPIFWDSPILFGLRKLSLAEIDTEPPSTLQIYNILVNCTRLEELEFNRVSVIEEITGEAAGPLGPPISLHNLREISIRGAPCNPWSAILGRIIALPACQKLVLTFQDPTNNTPHTPNFLSSSLSHLQLDLVRLYTAPLVRLFLRNDDYGDLGLSTLFTKSEATVEFDTSDGGDVADVSDHLLEWAPKLIAAAPKTLPIELSVCVDHPLAKLSSIQFLNVVILEITSTHIRRWPRAVAVGAVRDGYVALLNALAGKGTGNWSGRFAFPFLRLLRLDHDEGYADDLLEMLRCRKSAIQSAKGTAATIANGEAVRPFKVSFWGLHGQGSLMTPAAEIIGYENVLYGDSTEAIIFRKTHSGYRFEIEPHPPTTFLEDDDEQE